MADGSNEPSEGRHPFIIDPSKWTGTPWDKAGPNVNLDPKTNAELVAELHARLAAHGNVADLFGGAKGRSSSAKKSAFSASAGGGGGASKKQLGKAPQPMPSAQQMAKDPTDPNPFVDAFQLNKIPIAVTAIASASP
jgi:hypothetical protein